MSKRCCLKSRKNSFGNSVFGKPQLNICRRLNLRGARLQMLPVSPVANAGIKTFGLERLRLIKAR